MSKKWTHTQAFEHFGTSPRNVQWSWSARSVEHKVVVVTLWQDEFKRCDGKQVYERTSAEVAKIAHRLGFRELTENLAWARDNCDGRFRVIVAIAKDPKASPRSIKECFPSRMTMRLTSFDDITGAFTAETLEPGQT